MANFDIPVSRYMKAPVHTIHVDSPLQTAHERLHELAISCLAVVDDSAQLVGVISRSDLLRVGRREAMERSEKGPWPRLVQDHLLRWPEQSLGDLMTRDVLCVEPR